MNPWWLALILPAVFYAGYVTSNLRWIRSLRGSTKSDPYRKGTAQ